MTHSDELFNKSQRFSAKNSKFGNFLGVGGRGEKIWELNSSYLKELKTFNRKVDRWAWQMGQAGSGVQVS